MEENGVGQVRAFKELWSCDLKFNLDNETKVTIGAGKLISDTFENWFIPKLNTVENLNVNFIQIDNHFFGKDEVTVTGLLTAKDIIAQLKNKDLGDRVIFSDRILNDEGTLTLDDQTLGDMSKALNIPIAVCGDAPEDFFNVLATDFHGKL